MDGLPKFANVGNERPRFQEAAFEIGPSGMGLDLLRAVYRNSSVELSTRLRCAMACLPFETPKLLATAIINEGDFATILDRRLARLQQMENRKLIETQPETEMKPVEASSIEVKAPTPSLNYRSLRRRI